MNAHDNDSRLRGLLRGIPLALLTAFLAAVPGCVDDDDGPLGPPFPPPLLDPVTSPVNAASVTISGEARPGATVDISGSAVAQGTADAQGRFTLTVSLQTTPGAETQNTFSVLFSVGTETSGPATAHVLHDPVAPSAPLLQALTSPTNQPTVTVSGTTEPNAALDIQGGLVPVPTVADGLGAFSSPVTLHPNSTSNIYVTSTDLAGNTSAPATVNVTHDDIAPGAANAERIAAWFDGMDVRVAGGFAACEASATVDLLNEDTLASATLTAGTNGSFTAVLTGGDAGQTVRITVTDASSNQSPTPHPTVTTTCSWTQASFPGVPPARYAATLTPDPPNERLILFGGRDASGVRTDAIFQLDLRSGSESWSALTPSGGPPADRWGHAAAFDWIHGRVVIFGGEDGSQYYNDIWLLDVSTAGSESWTSLSPTGTPPAPRSFASVVFDPWNGTLVVYGGKDAATTYGDLWTCPLPLSGTPAWAQHTPTGTTPSSLWGHVACADVQMARMLLFGGINQGGGYEQGMFALSLYAPMSFSQITHAGGPGVVAKGAIFYDGLWNRMIHFGGDNGSQRLAGTHVFDMSTDAWLAPTIAGSPTAREMAACAFDPNTLRAFLFGGTSNGSTGTIDNELWQLK
jgi:hypothetical protein